ncbi:Protein CDT-2 [Aphelenchoides avenae]|nr:Protein CDT-2 [Aphelenchus avenae]
MTGCLLELRQISLARNAMDYSTSFHRGGCLPNRVPDSFIRSYASVETTNGGQWVSARFAADGGQHEHLLAIGDEHGSVYIADARHSYSTEKMIVEDFQADSSVIMDLCFLPGDTNKLITLSGGSEVRLWDLQSTDKSHSVLLKGHSKAVRCASFWQDNSNCFATGSRDGSICKWDLREQPRPPTPSRYSDLSPYYDPSRRIRDAHADTVGLTDSARKTRSNKKTAKELPSVTSMVHINEYCVVSASSSSRSGIRFWDMRYQQIRKPLRTLEIPHSSSQKETGVTSLCLDRYSHRIFAACTDSVIYEFSVPLNDDYPVNSYQANAISGFYIQCAASPISDHILCGSNLDAAFMWDLQEGRKSRQDALNKLIGRPRQYLPYPKYSFGGHKGEVATVCFSATGRYILTMDEERTRIWRSDKYYGYNEKEEKHVEEAVFDGRPLKLERPELLPAPTYGAETPAKRRLHSDFVAAKSMTRFSMSSPCTSAHAMISRPQVTYDAQTATSFVQPDSSYRSSKIITSPTKKLVFSPLKENRSPLKKMPKLELDSQYAYADNMASKERSRKSLTNVFSNMSTAATAVHSPSSSKSVHLPAARPMKTPVRRSRRNSVNHTTPGKGTPQSLPKITAYFSPKTPGT